MHAFLKTGKLSASSSSAGPSKEKVPKKKGPTPWVEKYRPKTVEDVAYQDEVVSVLKSTLQGADDACSIDLRKLWESLLLLCKLDTPMPVVESVVALEKSMGLDVSGQDAEEVLELNASDERGIQVVREKVKNFAQTTVSSIRPDGKPCLPYKIIILDEADFDDQCSPAALRRTREKQSRQPVCLICNYVSGLLSLSHRDVPISYPMHLFILFFAAHDIMVKRLSYICEEENVKYEDGALEVVIETSEGDLRRAITTLQSAARLRSGENIKRQDVYEITGVIPEKWLDELFIVCATDSYEKLSDFLNSMMIEGYSASQIMNQIHDRIISHDRLADLQKAAIFERLAICDHRLLEGGDEFLQVLDLCCTIMKQLCHST
ncbi:replication factor C subunit 4-like [Cherax quadricarinatus]